MINYIAQSLSSITCIILLSLGLAFCIALKFFFIPKSWHIFKSLIERNPASNVSPFAAVTLALAGTLGVGNILGISASIYYGGAGSIFWMWVGAFFSMILKYSEVLLSIKYREKRGALYFGGAFSYMKPRWVSVLFALLCVCASFSIGNFLQMNALSDILLTTCNIPKIVTGIATFIILSLIIGKNIKIISKITSIVIPIASCAYIILCLVFIILNSCYVPTVLKIIVKDALNIKAGIGGATAFTFSQSIRYGITRGLITNEAGCGTAPIAHACADTDSCVRQGFWGIFEVFFDTFVLCTLTAFVILCDTSGNYGYDIKYILSRFSSVFGGSSDIILSVCIVMFAISTLIGWSQYGVTSLSHIFSGKKSKQAYFMTYALLAVLGSIITSQLMWDLADITISVMTIINSMFLIKKIREIKYETQVYFKPYEKSK